MVHEASCGRFERSLFGPECRVRSIGGNFMGRPNYQQNKRRKEIEKKKKKEEKRKKKQGLISRNEDQEQGAAQDLGGGDEPGTE
jgi:hypothetical protein